MNRRFASRTYGLGHLLKSDNEVVPLVQDQSRGGSLTAIWERFFEWKRIEREDEPRRVSFEMLIRGVCEPKRFLDLVENFTVFSEQGTAPVKS